MKNKELIDCTKCGCRHKKDYDCQADIKSASAPGYKAMSLNRAISLLEDRADKNECDGECDEKAPYMNCNECEAVRVLNEINDMARKAI